LVTLVTTLAAIMMCKLSLIALCTAC
jgi:hypothetical protein